jgi:hypothetical protein
MRTPEHVESVTWRASLLERARVACGALVKTMAGAMKKAGPAVESFKSEGGERTYRIK